MADYNYSAKPKAAPVPSANKAKGKFRESETDPSTNAAGILMSGLLADPRVMKGNTYAKPKPSGKLANTNNAAANTNATTALAKTGWPGRKSIRKWNESRAPTPPPPEGRVSTHLQTDEYIEVLTSHAGTGQASQTFSFFDKPSDPLFNRKKLGHDTVTQIEPQDIFAFDIEVEPVLEVLLRSALHGAMLELLQEEELEAMESERQQHEQARCAELAEVQRLAAEKRRLEEEKAMRLRQAAQREQDQAELEERLAARQVANLYLDVLRQMALETMERQGILFDPLQREIEQQYLPALVAGVTRKVEHYSAAEVVLMEILGDALARARQHEAATQIYKLRAQDAANDALELSYATTAAAIFALLDTANCHAVHVASLVASVRENAILSKILAVPEVLLGPEPEQVSAVEGTIEVGADGDAPSSDAAAAEAAASAGSEESTDKTSEEAEAAPEPLTIAEQLYAHIDAKLGGLLSSAITGPLPPTLSEPVPVEAAEEALAGSETPADGAADATSDSTAPAPEETAAPEAEAAEAEAAEAAATNVEAAEAEAVAEAEAEAETASPEAAAEAVAEAVIEPEATEDLPLPEPAPADEPQPVPELAYVTREPFLLALVPLLRPADPNTAPIMPPPVPSWQPTSEYSSQLSAYLDSRRLLPLPQALAPSFRTSFGQLLAIDLLSAITPVALRSVWMSMIKSSPAVSSQILCIPTEISVGKTVEELEALFASFYPAVAPAGEEGSDEAAELVEVMVTAEQAVLFFQSFVYEEAAPAELAAE